MITIIYCHPYEHSFNHHILDAVTRQFTDEGREYDVINLYSENFDPVLDGSGLALYSKGETTDEQVVKYQHALRQTKHAIFIFHIWWGMIPVMLKCFCDKAFLKDVIYDTIPEGALLPCLSVDRATLITTSEMPSDVIEPFILEYFTPLVLNTVGMNNVEWFNCDKIKSRTDAHRSEFLDTVLKKLAI